MSIETKTLQEKIIALAAANSDTSKYYSGQLMAQFGTTRKSEILGIIGDNGQPFEKQIDDYIDSL